MADNLGYTPGSGATLATDDVGGVHHQRVKLSLGADGSATDAPGDATNGLKVQIATSAALPVTDNGGLLSVDDGAGSLTVDDGGGSLTVDSAQLPAALVGGRLDVNIGASSATVAATAAQGTPAAVANAWPVKISDGTNAVGITDVSGQKALKVDVVQTLDLTAQTDKSAFTEGSGRVSVQAGVVNDAISADPAEDQAAAIRITPKRAQHTNLRNNSGTEIGTSSNPIRTDPTGTTTQPVSGTVTATLDSSTNAGKAAKTVDADTGAGTDTVTGFALILPKSGGGVAGGTSSDPIRIDPTGTTNQPVNLAQVGGASVSTAASGIAKVGLTDEAGAAFSHSNPLPSVNTPPMEQTDFKNAATYSASQTDIALFTPTSGKRFMLKKLVITVQTSGTVKVYDHTNGATTMIYQGTPAAGAIIVIVFDGAERSAANNNVLRYSTGASATGDICVSGYEV